MLGFQQHRTCCTDPDKALLDSGLSDLKRHNYEIKILHFKKYSEIVLLSLPPPSNHWPKNKQGKITQKHLHVDNETHLKKVLASTHRIWIYH